MKLLTAIVPCFNEEENIADFYKEFMLIQPSLNEKDIDYEILFIDDGSKDGTVDEVKKLIKIDQNVRLVSFSRNFGKESAIYAGLQKSKGDYVVFLDADLQDPPSLLPEMFKYIEEGYDSVATRRVNRKDIYFSPTDMGVNMLGSCIKDDEIVREASKRELV